MKAQRASTTDSLFRPSGLADRQPLSAPLHGAAATLTHAFTRFAGFGLATSRNTGEATAFRQDIQRLIPGDPAIADQLYAARFGKTARLSPLARDFARLGWLKHFAAGGKTLHALYAMDLLRNWLQGHASRLEDEDAARALLSLSWDGPAMARRVGGEDIVMAAINRLARAVLNYHPVSDTDRLLRGIALLSAATVTTGLEPLRRPASDDLARVLDVLILPDGSHRNRRPEDLLRTAVLVVPLSLAMQRARDQVPESLHHAVERILPMLRMLTLADGGLSRLVADKPHAEALAALFDADQVRGKAPEQASQAGYLRLDFSGTTILADCRDAALDMSGSTGRLCIAVIGGDHRAQPLRSELVKSREGAVMRFEEVLSLRRSVFVAASGSDLRCEDYLAADEHVEIRLADGITIRPESGPSGFALVTPARDVWTAMVRGAVPVVEDRRILLLPNATGRDGRVNWALKKSSS